MLRKIRSLIFPTMMSAILAFSLTSASGSVLAGSDGNDHTGDRSNRTENSLLAASIGLAVAGIIYAAITGSETEDAASDTMPVLPFSTAALSTKSASGSDEDAGRSLKLDGALHPAVRLFADQGGARNGVWNLPDGNRVITIGAKLSLEF